MTRMCGTGVVRSARVVCTAHLGTQQLLKTAQAHTCKRIRSGRGTRWVGRNGRGNCRQRVDGLTTFTFGKLTAVGETAQDHHHHYQHIRMHAQRIASGLGFMPTRLARQGWPYGSLGQCATPSRLRPHPTTPNPHSTPPRHRQSNQFWYWRKLVH